MNSLVVLGTGAAYAYSTVATFAPALLPDGLDATYFEAGRRDRHADPARALASRPGPRAAPARRSGG